MRSSLCAHNNRLTSRRWIKSWSIWKKDKFLPSLGGNLHLSYALGTPATTLLPASSLGEVDLGQSERALRPTTQSAPRLAKAWNSETSPLRVVVGLLYTRLRGTVVGQPITRRRSTKVDLADSDETTAREGPTTPRKRSIGRITNSTRHHHRRRRSKDRRDGKSRWLHHTYMDRVDLL